MQRITSTPFAGPLGPRSQASSSNSEGHCVGVGGRVVEGVLPWAAGWAVKTSLAF